MNLEICHFQSTVIAKAGYNADRRILVLWFYGFPHVGYEYSDVPPKIWDGLVAAHSKGKFYRYNILGTYSVSQHIMQEEQKSTSPSSGALHAANGSKKLGGGMAAGMFAGMFAV